MQFRLHAKIPGSKVLSEPPNESATKDAAHTSETAATFGFIAVAIAAVSIGSFLISLASAAGENVGHRIVPDNRDLNDRMDLNV